MVERIASCRGFPQLLTGGFPSLQGVYCQLLTVSEGEGRIFGVWVTEGRVAKIQIKFSEVTLPLRLIRELE